MPIIDTLKKIIAEVIEIEIEDIKLKSFFSDLGANSLHIAEILMRTEDAFCIEISDEDEDCIKTVQNLIDYVEQRLLPGSLE